MIGYFCYPLNMTYNIEVSAVILLESFAVGRQKKKTILFKVRRTNATRYFKLFYWVLNPFRKCNICCRHYCEMWKAFIASNSFVKNLFIPSQSWHIYNIFIFFLIIVCVRELWVWIFYTNRFLEFKKMV